MKPHTLSAGIVIVRFDEGKPRYLLLRAYNYWDFPKGEVKPGEDSLDAAIREVKEETTLENLAFSWGKGYRETFPYGKGKIARYYLAESKEGEVKLSPEHHEFRWVEYEEARELLVDRLKNILNWSAKQAAIEHLS